MPSSLTQISQQAICKQCFSRSLAVPKSSTFHIVNKKLPSCIYHTQSHRVTDTCIWVGEIFFCLISINSPTRFPRRGIILLWESWIWQKISKLLLCLKFDKIYGAKSANEWVNILTFKKLAHSEENLLLFDVFNV